MQDELQTISKFFNGASFETKLSEDVYWVPFDEEGKNKHSYDEIKSLTKCLHMRSRKSKYYCGCDSAVYCIRFC